MVSGAVAGLVAVTPASGFAGPMGSIVLGLVAGAVCFFFCSTVKNALGYDDSLDVFGIHCVGGIVGAIATGILVAPALGGAGIPDYVTKPGELVVAEYVMATAVMAQIKAVLLTLVWSGVGSAILFKIVDVIDRPARHAASRSAKASTSPSTASAPTTTDRSPRARRPPAGARRAPALGFLPELGRPAHPAALFSVPCMQSLTGAALQVKRTLNRRASYVSGIAQSLRMPGPRPGPHGHHAMRTTRASTSGFDHLAESLRDFVRRRAAEITGLALLAVSAACGLALVTWSVQDPSLNHAIDGPVRNLLGRPGAIVADILMQLLGVASIALLAPPALAGLRLLAGRPLRRARLRIVLWIVGSRRRRGVASALPATARWPLPTGLGGVVGDAVLAVSIALAQHGPAAASSPRSAPSRPSRSSASPPRRASASTGPRTRTKPRERRPARSKSSRRTTAAASRASASSPSARSSTPC